MIKMITSKFYALPKNMSLTDVSEYLSERLDEHGFLIKPYDNMIAGVYRNGEKIGSLAFHDKFGIQTHSSDLLSAYEFGSLLDEEYEDTGGFRWRIVWTSEGADNKGVSEALTARSRHKTNTLIK